MSNAITSHSGDKVACARCGWIFSIKALEIILLLLALLYGVTEVQIIVDPSHFGPQSRRAKWFAQAILSDAIKQAVAWLATKIRVLPAGVEIAGVTLACGACGLGVTCANGLAPIHNGLGIVLGVGSVLLQLLAVQHELGEPFNLNGDLIEDLKDENPIPVVVNGASKRKENEEIGAERLVKWVKLDPKKKGKGRGITASKRKGDEDIDDKKPAKRARTHQRKAQEVRPSFTRFLQALKSPSVNYLGQEFTYFGTVPTDCITLSPPFVSSVSSVQIAKGVRCTLWNEAECGRAAGKSITLNDNVLNLVNLEFNDLTVAFECLA
ncbi:hypothetical protein DFH09DRAFT_1104607 [Mycena vulgaris]|nr:hypothetical protein DFH09DRAFT_1104607 [Mycena vulgaris]